MSDWINDNEAIRNAYGKFIFVIKLVDLFWIFWLKKKEEKMHAFDIFTLSSS